MRKDMAPADAEAFFEIAKQIKEDPTILENLQVMGAVALAHTNLMETAMRKEKVDSRSHKIALAIGYLASVFVSGTLIVGCVWGITWMLESIKLMLGGH